MKPLPVDPGLLARFREAGTRVIWKVAPRPNRSAGVRSARIGRLSDEEVRVEAWGSGRSGGVAADSGPLGALLLLLEADRRGRPDHWGSWNAGRDLRFPQGAVVAAWGGPVPRSDSTPRIEDLIEIARYALA